MAETLYWTAFSNNGQVCAGLKRLYVPEAMADELCDRLAAVAETVRVGNGLEEGTTTGPVQNQVQLARVRELLEDAWYTGPRSRTRVRFPKDPGGFSRSPSCGG